MHLGRIAPQDLELLQVIVFTVWIGRTLNRAYSAVRNRGGVEIVFYKHSEISMLQLEQALEPPEELFHGLSHEQYRESFDVQLMPLRISDDGFTEAFFLMK